LVNLARRLSEPDHELEEQIVDSHLLVRKKRSCSV
jgi:hypothetical protein